MSDTQQKMFVLCDICHPKVIILKSQTASLETYVYSAYEILVGKCE